MPGVWNDAPAAALAADSPGAPPSPACVRSGRRHARAASRAPFSPLRTKEAVSVDVRPEIAERLERHPHQRIELGTAAPSHSELFDARDALARRRRARAP